MTVAALGFQIDSSQASKATSELDRLTQASQRTEKETLDVKRASDAASASLIKLDRAASALAASEARLSRANASVAQATAKAAAAEKQLATERAKATKAGADAAKSAEAIAAAELKLAIAAQQAASAQKSLESATKNVAFNQKVFADSTDKSALAQRSFQEQSRKTGTGLVVLQKNAGLARHELINLGRQAQDVGTMLAMGASPMQVFSSQAAQIFDIFSSSKGTIGGFGRQVMSVITPIRALTAGLAIAGVGATIAYSKWTGFAKQLDTTAKLAGITANEMSKLQGTASFKGIDTEAFSQQMGKVSAQAFAAKRGFGDLAQMLREAGVPAARDFNDAIGKVADLVKNARSEQEKVVILQKLGLDATREWVNWWSQGSEGINKAKSALQGVGKEHDELLRKQKEMDDKWNKMTTTIGEGFRNAFVKATFSMVEFFEEGNRRRLKAQGFNRGRDTFESRAAGATNDVNSLYTGNMDASAMRAALERRRDQIIASGATSVNVNKKPAYDPFSAENLQRQIQSLSLLGQTISAKEAERMVELQLTQARQNGLHIDEKRAAILKQRAIDDNLGVTQIRQMTEAYNLEAQTFGMTTSAAQAYLITQNLINQARRDGKPDMDARIAALQREEKALAEAIAKSESMNETRALFGSVSSSMVTGLTDIADKTKGVGEGFRDLSKTIQRTLQEAMMKAMVVQPIMNALMSTMGMGGGGILGLLGIGGGGGPISTFGGAGANFPVPTFGFASGGFTGFGPRDKPAGTVHKGEFVFSKRATENIGINKLDRIHRSAALTGYASGGMVGGGRGDGPAVQIDVRSDPRIKTETKESTKGGVTMVEMVHTIVEGGLSSGRYNGTLRNSHNLRPRPIFR